MGTTWTFKEAPIENGDGATIWYIPAMKNAIIMVIAGVLVQSLLAQILGMLRRPTADARQPVLGLGLGLGLGLVSSMAC